MPCPTLTPEQPPDENPELAKDGAGKKDTPRAKVPSKIQKQTKKRALEQLSTQEDGEEKEEEEEKEEAEPVQKKMKMLGNIDHEVSLKQLINTFLLNFIVISSDESYLTTQEISNAFVSQGFEMDNFQTFAHALGKELKSVYPSAKPRKTKTSRGYVGIALK
jgi:hypothetical protein